MIFRFSCLPLSLSLFPYPPSLSQPPIIRLYDLHVRVNASVRSGVQLLLLEKGIAPEMFRLDFQSKKEAKAYVTHTQ